MRTAQRLVREFHALISAPNTDTVKRPCIPPNERRLLRARLIIEEAVETCNALGVGVEAHVTTEGEQKFETKLWHADDYECMDVASVIDGVCDTIYVLLGTAEECGFEVYPFFLEVARNNMSKAASGVKDAFGKVLKPANHRPPCIDKLLDAYDAVMFIAKYAGKI